MTYIIRKLHSEGGLSAPLARPFEHVEYALHWFYGYCVGSNRTIVGLEPDGDHPGCYDMLTDCNGNPDQFVIEFR